MLLVDYGLAAIALLGHLAIWVAVFNRLHAAALPCRLVNLLEKAIAAACLLIPVLMAWRWIAAGIAGPLNAEAWRIDPISFAYFAACAVFFLFLAPTWLWRRWAAGLPPALVSNDTRVANAATDIAAPLVDGFAARLAAAVPGNQILQLHVNHKALQLRRLPQSLEGLTITHLSDLHFTGEIRQEFFDYVVDRANELDSDLVAITGDIIDKARCREWIGQTLGRLKSRHGVFFVLGNHDKRHRDTPKLRREIVEAGMVDLGERWLRLEIGVDSLALAGNELPWFAPAADMENCPQQFGPRRALRILLSHSPDQFKWARSYDFDLMLAGHTHGGQIRFPLIGPVVSPSIYGVKYASGVFYESPTVMHVSRGVSGLHPLRFNCAPEVTQLELRRAECAAT